MICPAQAANKAHLPRVCAVTGRTPAPQDHCPDPKVQHLGAVASDCLTGHGSPNLEDVQSAKGGLSPGSHRVHHSLVEAKEGIQQGPCSFSKRVCSDHAAESLASSSSWRTRSLHVAQNGLHFVGELCKCLVFCVAFQFRSGTKVVLDVLAHQIPCHHLGQVAHLCIFPAHISLHDVHDGPHSLPKERDCHRDPDACRGRSRCLCQLVCIDLLAPLLLCCKPCGVLGAGFHRIIHSIVVHNLAIIDHEV
mmetsp:Transcript_52649/g.98559  ORF Transcript_52649/g.98559 Transcript_52649/m.98559 type:complete len:249 (+) Transcript_52649:1494-2240(+)